MSILHDIAGFILHAILFVSCACHDMVNERQRTHVAFLFGLLQSSNSYRAILTISTLPFSYDIHMLIAIDFRALRPCMALTANGSDTQRILLPNTLSFLTDIEYSWSRQSTFSHKTTLSNHNSLLLPSLPLRSCREDVELIIDGVPARGNNQ